MTNKPDAPWRDRRGHRDRPDVEPSEKDPFHARQPVDISELVRQTYQLMVVCHCNAVSDHEIRAAVAAGACDAEGLAASCNAGTRCGGCQPVVDAILSETTVTIATAA